MAPDILPAWVTFSGMFGMMPDFSVITTSTKTDSSEVRVVVVTTQEYSSDLVSAAQVDEVSML